MEAPQQAGSSSQHRIIVVAQVGGHLTVDVGENLPPLAIDADKPGRCIEAYLL